MSNPTDSLKNLIKEVNVTIDFVTVEKQLQEIIEEIQKDTSLLAFQKESAIIGAERALEKLRGRFNNPAELGISLANMRHRIASLNETEIESIYQWFFRVAYSGLKITPQMEQDFQPILAKYSPNQDSNKDRLYKDCQKYARFAKEGPDLERTRCSLEGIKIASHVYILPNGFSEQIRDCADNALQIINSRKKLTKAELIKEVILYCDKLISPNYKKHKTDREHYLQQEDSWFLSSYLTRSIELVEMNDFPDDEASELAEQLNHLRSKFQEIRYRSSTLIFQKLAEQIELLRERTTKNIDFPKLKNQVKVLQGETKTYQYGKKGANRMEKYHVDRAFSMLNQVYEFINKRQYSKEELEWEIKRFELEAAGMSKSTIPPTSRAIQRIQKYAERDSLLGQWISSCHSQPSDEKKKIVDRVKNIWILCQEMWIKMEKAQQQRLNEFHDQCNSIENNIKSAVEFRSQWSEISQLDRSIEDFPLKNRDELFDKVNILKSKMNERINDRQACIRYIQDLESSINDAHYQIRRFIDFDAFYERAVLSKRWVENDFYKQLDKMELQIRVQNNFNQIRILKRRQEKDRFERSQRAVQLYEDLSGEVSAGVEEAVSNPGRPQSWQLLIDIDRRVRESFHILDNTQKNDLKKRIDNGFDQVKQLRFKFASEAAIVFASYSDDLNNILAELEEELSYNSAYEAIERIKPMRSRFKNETRLLRVQKDEIYNLIRIISSTIDEVFEKAETQASDEFNRIQADFEKLDNKIKISINWSVSDLESAINAHKQLSQFINQANLHFADRKECRAEMDRLWIEISEQMRIVRANRFSTTNLEDTIRQLERDGYMLFTNDIPNIK